MATPHPTPSEHHLPVRADHHRRKWQWMAPAGLLGVGLGASAVARATVKWADGRPYFWHGTFALFCLNASLSVFADAVKHRALYEMKTER
ncbi:MAG: hypothetical protein AAGI91_09360 [Bacteroidota bacterium]